MEDWKVRLRGGRAGHVEYTEQGVTLQFYWEFDGGGAEVSVPGAVEWDGWCGYRGAPWAYRRRDEILARVRAYLLTTQCPGAEVLETERMLTFRF